jgi:hypothetical protein
MLSRTSINRIILFVYLLLVGFSLAKAIYHQSIMGILLSLVSLGAGIHFLYILYKAKDEIEADEAS